MPEASLEELISAVTVRLASEHKRAAEQLAEVEAAKKKQRVDAKAEERIFGIMDSADDVVELNVGGQPLSTTRKVPCSAEGSPLAALFSGNFDSSHKRDKEGRIFLDADPDVFKKVLSYLRLRQMSGPLRLVPLPHVPEEQVAEFDVLVQHYGLEDFMYGSGLENIFQKIATHAKVDQSALHSAKLVELTHRSSRESRLVSPEQEKVLGSSGLVKGALENLYSGPHPSTLTITFPKHRVWVRAMELRAELEDVAEHMSRSWTFRHGKDSIAMSFGFSKHHCATGRLETAGVSSFADEVAWVFPGDFCLQHIALYGYVMPKPWLR